MKRDVVLESVIVLLVLVLVVLLSFLVVYSAQAQGVATATPTLTITPTPTTYWCPSTSTPTSIIPVATLSTSAPVTGTPPALTQTVTPSPTALVTATSTPLQNNYLMCGENAISIDCQELAPNWVRYYVLDGHYDGESFFGQTVNLVSPPDGNHFIHMVVHYPGGAISQNQTPAGSLVRAGWNGVFSDYYQYNQIGGLDINGWYSGVIEPFSFDYIYNFTSSSWGLIPLYTVVDFPGNDFTQRTLERTGAYVDLALDLHPTFPTPTPAPCVPADAMLSDSEFISLSPITITPGACYTIIPPLSVTWPETVQAVSPWQLPDLSLSGVELCVSYFSMTAQLAGIDIMSVAYLMVNFSCVLVLYREFKS